MQRAVVLVAGGTGTRMRSLQPKQFLTLNDKPVIIETLLRFLDWDENIIPVVVIYAQALSQLKEFINIYIPEHLKSRILITEGGSTRTCSVANGIEILFNTYPNSEILVAVHDAVRPLITPDLLSLNFDLAEKAGNAVCCVPVKSSLRLKTPTGSQALDRSQYFHVQTPQTFLLKQLHHWLNNRPNDDFTDEASLAEQAGESIHISEGNYSNIKITTPEDLVLARFLLQNPDFIPQ